MRINKENFILSIIGILPVLWLVDYTKPKIEFLYFLLIPLFVIPSIFIAEKEKPDESDGKYIAVPINKICPSWLLDWFIFILVCFFASFIINNIFRFYSDFLFYVLFYIYLMHNILYRSISFRLLNLYVDRNSVGDKLKILIVNFIILFPFYFAMLGRKLGFPKETMDKVFLFSFLIDAINCIFRIFVFKTQSLYEKIFGIQTMQFSTD